MVEWTRDTPWRQGQLLTDEAVQAWGLVNADEIENILVVVATHDCDLTQSIEKEPKIEVMVGRRITSIDGNFSNAKVARTLHVAFQGEPLLLAEFTATSKEIIRKEQLIDFQPREDYTLSPESQSIFQRWLASRYRRSAFPDEFEQRLKDNKLDQSIAKAVKPHGGMIVLVLFNVDEGQELAKTDLDDPYELEITLVYAIEPDPEQAESAANKAKIQIKEDFEKKLYKFPSGWKDIELRAIGVISDEALSYRQFTLAKPWRLEHLSLGADPQQPIAPD